MSTLLENLKVPLLSIAFLATLEFTIIKIAGDHQSCFFHNTITGNVLSLVVRLIAFAILCAVLSTLSLPRYSSLKDRLQEKEELEEQKNQHSPVVFEGATLNEATV